jgi:hypothetical protein
MSDETAADSRHTRAKVRLGRPHEAGDHIRRPVPPPDLRQPVTHRHWESSRTRRHVAVGEGIAEPWAWHRKLRCQLPVNRPLPSLYDRAGVVGHQPAQDRISVVHITQIPCPIKGMKPRVSQFGGVTDVMQPGRGLKQPGVTPEDRSQESGSLSHPLNMRPPAGQRNLKQLACEFFGPENLIHALQARHQPWDEHRRRVPSGDVWLRRRWLTANPPQRALE